MLDDLVLITLQVWRICLVQMKCGRVWRRMKS